MKRQSLEAHGKFFRSHALTFTATHWRTHEPIPLNFKDLFYNVTHTAFSSRLVRDIMGNRFDFGNGILGATGKANAFHTTTGTAATSRTSQRPTVPRTASTTQQQPANHAAQEELQRIAGDAGVSCARHVGSTNGGAQCATGTLKNTTSHTPRLTASTTA